LGDRGNESGRGSRSRKGQNHLERQTFGSSKREGASPLTGQSQTLTVATAEGRVKMSIPNDKLVPESAIVSNLWGAAYSASSYEPKVSPDCSS
jgi:hypothetical protein